MSRDAFLDLVRWYGEVGIDVAVDEHPHDRFAEAAAKAAGVAGQPVVADNEPAAASAVPYPPATPTSANPDGGSAARPAVRGAVALSAEQAIQGAREAAAAADTLDALRAALERFEGCGLKITATQLVFADGDPRADLMLVGGTPDDEDDRGGSPFAGKAGTLLERMLAAIGLARAAVYTAQAVPWRPPGNRQPSATEVAVCLPFIRRQIELVAPRILVCLGDVSVAALLLQKAGAARLRGQWLEYAIEAGSQAPPTIPTPKIPAQTIPAMAMLHPATLLRAPLQKRLAWSDLQAVAAALAALAPRVDR